MSTNRPHRESVLLCNFIADFAEQRSFHSLGLYSLKAYAQTDNNLGQHYDIAVVDFKPATTDPYEIIERHGAAVIGFSCYLWSLDVVVECIEKLHSAHPEVTIIVGGVAAGLERVIEQLPEGLLLCEDPFDGEVVFRDVLLAKLRGESFDGIAGLSTVSRGAILRGPPPKPVADVNDIPSPYLTGLIELEPGNRYFQLQTARGCIGKCAYCVGGASGGGLRHFQRQRVADEIAWARAQQVEVVVITDAAINYRDGHLASLCDTIAAAGIDGELTFSYCLHPAFVSAAQLDSIRQIIPVTDSIIIGVQSLSGAAQETMNRSYSNERVLRGIERVCELFTPNVDLILGLPGETLESFKQSVLTLKNYPINLHIHPLTIVAGTEYARKKEAYGILHEDHRGGHRVTATSTFGSRDFYLSFLFIHDLVRSGTLQDAELRSLSMSGFPYFLREEPEPPEDSEPLEEAARERPEAPAEPASSTIEPRLLDAIGSLIAVGRTIKGWTIAAVDYNGPLINVTAEQGERHLGIRLHRSAQEQPCFKRTASFNVIYWYPEELSGIERRWLEHYVMQLARCERQVEDRR